MNKQCVRRGRRRAATIALAGAAAIATMASPLRAVDHTWIGPSGGSWSVASNWAPTGVPQPGGFNEQTLIGNITTPLTVFFDYDYSAAMLNSVELQPLAGGAEVTLQLNPNPGTKKFNTNNVAVGEFGHAELIDSAQPIITNTLYVGFGATAFGTVTLSGTAPVTAGYVSLGQVGFGTIIQSGSSSMTVTGSYDIANFGTAWHRITGGTLSIPTAPVSVGWHGSGTLEVSGGVVGAHQIWVGSGAADTSSPQGLGSLMISGTGHASMDSLWVGLQPEPPPDPEDPPPPGDIIGGSGSVRTVGSGASLQAGFINSRGTISVENQSSISAGTINLGHLGAGTMTVVGGGSATIGTLVVGLDAPPAAITLPTSLFQFNGGLVNIAGDTTIGAGTPGRMTQGGGIFTGNRVVVGPTSGAGMFAEVSMIGGTFNTNADVILADHGTATFSVDTLPNVVPTTVRVGGALTIGNGAGTLGVGNGTFALVNGSLTVNTSNAPGTAETIGAAGNGTVLQSAGAHRVNGDLVMGRDAGSRGYYGISGGSLSVGGVMNVGMSGTSTLQLDGGRVIIPSAIRVRPTGKVNFNGGQIDLSPGTGSLASGGGMIVDYSGAATQLPMLRAQIISGYANGAWTGPGIMSTLAQTNHSRAIGYAEATDIFSIFPATFMSQTGIGNHTVLIRHTLAGDSDLSGKVDLTDFTFLAANFNGTNKNWVQGDYNYDSTVDLTDFTLLASNFNQSLTAATMSTGVPVPEPGCVLTCAGVSLQLLTNSRRYARKLRR